VKSAIYNFADDTKIFRSINNPEDTKIQGMEEYMALKISSRQM